MLALLFLLLLWGLTLDVLHRKIPNIVILIGMFCGFTGSLYSSGGLDVTHALLGMLVGFGLFIVPYSMSVLGAGDVKLLAMVGVFLGPGLTLVAAIYTLIVGGLVAICYAFHAGIMKHSLSNIVELKAGVYRMPYSIAISLGTFGAVCHQALR